MTWRPDRSLRAALLIASLMFSIGCATEPEPRPEPEPQPALETRKPDISAFYTTARKQGESIMVMHREPVSLARPIDPANEPVLLGGFFLCAAIAESGDLLAVSIFDENGDPGIFAVRCQTYHALLEKKITPAQFNEAVIHLGNK